MIIIIIVQALGVVYNHDSFIYYAYGCYGYVEAALKRKWFCCIMPRPYISPILAPIDYRSKPDLYTKSTMS